MKNIKLDSILLVALLIPFIMSYRLSPGQTPYWLFGLIFLGLFLYIILDIFPFKIPFFTLSQVKLMLLWCLILCSIATAFSAAIIVRHQTSPVYNVHDIILQQEAAIRFFLHGRNPYEVTYFHTPLEMWHYSDTEVNPALYHFVMQPFYLLFPIPFYLVLGHTVGFFDARIPLFLLFFVTLVLATYVKMDTDKIRQFIILLAFNPATLGYLLEGRDDIFLFTFLFASLLCYFYKKNTLAGISMGIAFAIKQSIWPLFPFYIAYQYYQHRSLTKTLTALLPFTITCLIFIGPFMLWNPHAFLQSTIFYLSGNDPHSYPVAGYGLGSMLNQMGVIKNVHAYYPFWIWQGIISLPLLICFLWIQRKHNSIRTMIIFYALFLFVFWYLSRYFNNSHLGYLSMLFILAYYWPEETIPV